MIGATPGVARRTVCEAVGTALLLAAVVGSGIDAQPAASAPLTLL